MGGGGFLVKRGYGENFVVHQVERARNKSRTGFVYNQMKSFV